MGGDTVILAIDVGNTNIVIGGFKDDSLEFVGKDVRLIKRKLGV